MGERLEFPPITEMVLTTQFEPSLLALGILDVATVFESFKDRFPVFKEVPQAGPMRPDPRSAVTHAISAIPRLQFATEDLSRLVLFQNDRFSFAWQRTTSLEEQCDYPTFEPILEEYISERGRFLDAVRRLPFPEIRPLAIEVAYVNALTLGKEGKRRRVSDVVTFFDNPREAPLISLDVSWTELLRAEEQELRSELSGVVNVSCGPGNSPEGDPMLILSLTAVADARNVDWNDVSLFEEAHAKISEVFKSSVRQEALKGF